MQIYCYYVMTDLNLVQFDIHVYYINRYICRLPFITYIYIYIYIAHIYVVYIHNLASDLLSDV